MDFGQALQELRKGNRVARSGWNGKGMWLALTPGSKLKRGASPLSWRERLHGTAAKLLEEYDESGETLHEVNTGAHIDMRAADGSLVIGWLASQTDMLADDWNLVGAFGVHYQESPPVPERPEPPFAEQFRDPSHFLIWPIRDEAGQRTGRWEYMGPLAGALGGDGETGASPLDILAGIARDLGRLGPERS
jgi:hypothetical protein